MRHQTIKRKPVITSGYPILGGTAGVGASLPAPRARRRRPRGPWRRRSCRLVRVRSCESLASSPGHSAQYAGRSLGAVIDAVKFMDNLRDALPILVTQPPPCEPRFRRSRTSRCFPQLGAQVPCEVPQRRQLLQEVVYRCLVLVTARREGAAGHHEIGDPVLAFDPVPDSGHRVPLRRRQHELHATRAVVGRAR